MILDILVQLNLTKGIVRKKCRPAGCISNRAQVDRIYMKMSAEVI